MKIIKESVMNTDAERKLQYNQYLTDHINAVKKAWKEILYEVLLTESDLTVEELTEIQEEIDHHDRSKYDQEEYVPYLDHFYPVNEGDQDIPENLMRFNYAWLRHQHLNGHHPQHWVLNTDSGEKLIMDMPFKYICGMLCDWSSFQYTDKSGNTANEWYKDNKNKLLLSDNTRKIVEDLLGKAPKL